jgi:UDP-N-acetylmuramate--alanine ligase
MDATSLSAPPDSAKPLFQGKRVHFIGVGGSGMIGLARMLLDAGAIVTGSEPSPSPQTAHLIAQGAKISSTQTGQLLDRNIDLVVRSAAIRENNPEYQAARALKIRTVKYAQLLGMVMGQRLGVAVAGTHGKSTTTAMISFALLENGADPSFLVGGTVPQLGGSSRCGQGEIFVAEACEYDRSFHNLKPRIAVITNIEADHLDFYKNIEEIVASFRDFAQMVPPYGLIIAGDDSRITEALTGIETPIQRAALAALPGKLDWATRIVGLADGCYRGEVLHNAQVVGELQLSIAGRHNLINATLATAACAACGLAPKDAIAALNRFTGVDRRMSFVGRHNGATIVDDYGHHPTEIRATLKALRERFSPRRLFCVFQPHQHSRTRFLLDEFAGSFDLADQVIVPEIYSVRDSEAERRQISSADLVERLKSHGRAARYLSEFPAIVDYLDKAAGPGDLIVTMGAGNVWEIGRQLNSG